MDCGSFQQFIPIDLLNSPSVVLLFVSVHNKKTVINNYTETILNEAVIQAAKHF